MASPLEHLPETALPQPPIPVLTSRLSVDEQLDKEVDERRADIARWAKTPAFQVDDRAVYQSLLGNFTLRLPRQGYWYGAEFTDTLDVDYTVTKDNPERSGAIDLGVGFVTTRRQFFTVIADAAKAAGVPAELIDVRTWQEAYTNRARLNEYLPQLYQAYRALRKEGYARKTLTL